MNCKNCGGHMLLYREQDYYHCEYCNSFHFPTVSPDGVRFLGETPEGTTCPRCQIILQMVTLDNAYRGFRCEKCQGLLLTRSSFRLTVETRRAMAATAPEAQKPLNREELNRKLDCPICHQRMMTHPYMGPGTIVIDTYDHCNIIWLDYGELGRIIDAPGKDRGTGLGQVIDRLQDEKKIKKKKKKKTQYDKDFLELLDKFF